MKTYKWDVHIHTNSSSRNEKSVIISVDKNIYIFSKTVLQKKVSHTGVKQHGHDKKNLVFFYPFKINVKYYEAGTSVTLFA